MKSIKERLQFLYPEEYEAVWMRTEQLIHNWKDRGTCSYPWVSYKDVLMITYGDGIRRKGEPSLRVLKEFLDSRLQNSISAVHILPMFPYTSDDGFSVTDFREIHPDLGDWEQIGELKEHYDLMFDAVVNHVSKSSRYFEGFLREDPRYRDFFIAADPAKDYSMVTRPRTLPLLTKFETASGSKYIWTTFSGDQVDLNYKNPDVLLEVLDVLLLYASCGARFIRFDAIGFAWKEEGTTCMHLTQTHELVKVMRQVLESCFPGCTVITETNVPHQDNIAYFGNGYDEAGLVYQFPLPPLTLYSYISGSAKQLSEWAASLEPTTEKTTYFNFLASHDGIGMRPVEDLLSKEQRDQMVQAVLERGGQIGYRSLPDGSEMPYELNINYLDAVAGNEADPDVMVRKFLSSQCVLLSVVGMPAIYYHSLLGSRNCYRDYEESGIKRRINREKLDAEVLDAELGDERSLRARVLKGYQEMIRIRREQKAFDPASPQEVLFLDERLFTLRRGQEEAVLVLINVSGDPVTVNTGCCGNELFSAQKAGAVVTVPPYGYYWIQTEQEAWHEICNCARFI